MLSRGGYIVLHNEEVVREAHLADGLELEVYPFLLLLRERLAVAGMCTAVAKLAQVSHRLAEGVSAVFTDLAARCLVFGDAVSALVYDILVLFKLVVYDGEELGVYLILGKYVGTVY